MPQYLWVSILAWAFLGQPIAVGQIEATVAWRYHSQKGACEIAAFSPATKRIFVTVGGGVDVVAIRTGSWLDAIEAPTGYHATSVACCDNAVAIAWAADDKRERGRITFYGAADLNEIASYTAGFLPDMITFTPDGTTLLAANEGEPTDDYSFDAEASITIIKSENGWAEARVREATFVKFNAERDALIARGLHLFGPKHDAPGEFATVAQDVEPEYIAVSSDSQSAWITLQENNGVARLDIEAGEIVAIYPLGLKNFRTWGHTSPTRLTSTAQGTGLDASDKDGGVRIRHWPIWGMYQPDGIATFRQNGHDYLVTANEGDDRDYVGCKEAVRVGKLSNLGIELDPANPARWLVDDDQLGRLEVSRYAGDTDGDGDLDRLVCHGTRSFSIWRDTGEALELIYDSGSDCERIVSQVAPERFNANSQADSLPDKRSSKRGPEPENVVLLTVGEQKLVAIGLERTGGTMIYDITHPHEPNFCVYLPPYESGGLLDTAPEGMLAIAAEESPWGKPLLIICNEGSRTMTAYQLGN